MGTPSGFLVVREGGWGGVIGDPKRVSSDAGGGGGSGDWGLRAGFLVVQGGSFVEGGGGRAA